MDAWKEELDSWKLYGNALSQPNRDLFFQMLSEVEKYGEAAKVHGDRFSAESMFMALIFEQQKTILFCLQKLASLEKAKQERIAQQNQR